MFEFLGELEDVAADLYPYRWPITIGLIVAVVALIVIGVRLGWHRALWEHRLLSAAVAIPVLIFVLPVGWYTLSPLWERSHLDESSPLAVATPAVPTVDEAVPTPGGASEASFTARVTHSGMFEGADDFHFGQGNALLIETAPGVYTLRFEEFSVRNGPDLFVYLTNDPDDVEGAVILGDLKATDGNFNYDIPADVDPTEFDYAIVWCRQFATLFATAPLDDA